MFMRFRFGRSTQGMASAEYAFCVALKTGAGGWANSIDSTLGRLSDLGSWLDLRTTRWHVPWRAP